MGEIRMIASLLDAMRFRCIGPPRGGRVVTVAGDPSEALGGVAPRHPNGTSRNAMKDTRPTRVTKVAPA